MRTIWTVVCTLALANLLAMAGFVAWLNSTDRLSKDRVQKVRQLFVRTVADESQEQAAAQASAGQAQKDAAEAARLARPPVDAAAKIAENQREADMKLQAVLRRQQELDNLRAALMHQVASIEQREQKLANERAAFEASRKRIAEIEGAEQFKTALTTLEAQKPKEAKAVLRAMLDGRQDEQVIAYLAKMDETKRGKVMAEFVRDDPTVAADLLERLRTRGIVATPGPLSPAIQAADADTDAPATGSTQP